MKVCFFFIDKASRNICNDGHQLTVTDVTGLQWSADKLATQCVESRGRIHVLENHSQPGFFLFCFVKFNRIPAIPTGTVPVLRQRV